MNKVLDIRKQFVNKWLSEDFEIDKTGCKVVELIGTSFVANEPTIFGKVNYDYIDREIAWYKSMSLSVADIPSPIPKIWKQVASKHGEINSNYGWCIWSQANWKQYQNCLKALMDDKDTRRAIMIYTRPEMQYEYNSSGMSDFICTNTVQYLIRDDKLYAIVNMRSNDAWAGYRNDRAWQMYVLKQLGMDLLEKYHSLTLGQIIWQTGSIHLYESQFYLLEAYEKFGIYNLTKKEYDKIKQFTKLSI